MSEEIKIVKKKIVTKKKSGRPAKYPFRRMVPGDSFEAKSTYINMWGCLRNYVKKNNTVGVNFVIRQHPDKEGFVEVFCVPQKVRRSNKT